MAGNEGNVWDAARVDAAKQTKSARKQQRDMKIQAATRVPVLLMRLGAVLMVLYALVLYVPAFINIKPLILQTDTHSGAQTKIDNRNTLGPFAAISDKFKLNKGYMRKGQSFQAQYILPENATAILTVKRCARFIFIEAFYCKDIQAQTTDLSSETVGTRRFHAKDSAMYVFESQVTVNKGQRYDITWQRN